MNDRTHHLRNMPLEASFDFGRWFDANQCAALHSKGNSGRLLYCPVMVSPETTDLNTSPGMFDDSESSPATLRRLWLNSVISNLSLKLYGLMKLKA